jgi:hypothetical protein
LAPAGSQLLMDAFQSMPDGRLLRAAREDPEAFGAFYRRHVRRRKGAGLMEQLPQRLLALQEACRGFDNANELLINKES